MADRGVGVADVEPREGVELRAGVQAFGQGVEIQARREGPGRQGLVVRGEAEELHRGVEGQLPGPPRAGKGLGDGRGAGRQADQERRVREPVREFRTVGGFRSTDGARRCRHGVADPVPDPVLELLRPERVQHGALPLPRDGGGKRGGEVQRVPLRQHGHGRCVRHQAGSRVPQLLPAQALPVHDDNGPVGAFIGPALEFVQKWHQTNFTGPELLPSSDAIL
jgi:hypothetical protein